MQFLESQRRRTVRGAARVDGRGSHRVESRGASRPDIEYSRAMRVVEEIEIHLDHIVDGYEAMDDRRAIKSLVRIADGARS